MIIFINSDISFPQLPPTFVGSNPANANSYTFPSELTNIQTQLFIDDTMTKDEFDARVAVLPDYPSIIHLQNLRILVILPTFHDFKNRHLADVVVFLYQGLANIEYNHFGPPCQSLQLQYLTPYQLFHRDGEGCFSFLPFGCGINKCGGCGFPAYCDHCHTFSGEPTCRKCQCDCKCFCNIHAPNCENEFHNPAFLRRNIPDGYHLFTNPCQ